MAWIARAWSWVSLNSDALIVVVTGVGVIVAGCYAVLTWLLAGAAKAQARSAEAAHRPYLRITLGSAPFFADPQFFRFMFSVQNCGSVPAVITASALIVKREGQTVVTRSPLSESGEKYLFPEEGAEYWVDQGLGTGRALVEAEGTTDVEVTVRYRSWQNRCYWTRVVFAGDKKRWVCRHLDVA